MSEMTAGMSSSMDSMGALGGFSGAAAVALSPTPDMAARFEVDGGVLSGMLLNTSGATPVNGDGGGGQDGSTNGSGMIHGEGAQNPNARGNEVSFGTGGETSSGAFDFVSGSTAGNVQQQASGQFYNYGGAPVFPQGYIVPPYYQQSGYGQQQQ